MATSDDEPEEDEDFDAHAGLEWVEGVTVETEGGGSSGLSEEEIKKSVRKGMCNKEEKIKKWYNSLCYQY